jgi:hypothetical protein
MDYLRRFITTLSLAVFLGVSLPNMAFANETGTETGDDVAVVFDLVVLRPVGLVATAAGLLIFVGSLPISIPTLSVGKALNALVVGPSRYTFVRELGESSIPPP